MRSRTNLQNNIHYNIMMLPAVVFLIVFSIYPLLGSVLAFKKLSPKLGIWGSEWVGLKYFQTLFQIPSFWRIIYNTVFIAILKMAAHLIIPLAFALLLNEIRVKWFKRATQTIVYLPYFLSWVIMAGIFKDLFAGDGMINKLIMELGMRKSAIMFFGDNNWFPGLIVASDVWKNFGFNAIIYLAALTNIDPTLYEAANVDGATRWQQLRNITLPGIVLTVVLLSALSLQNVLNAGFEQILNFYNPLVYQSGDILDTYIFRMGFQDNQFELATAVGLLKSIVSFLLIILAQRLAGRYAGYRIF